MSSATSTALPLLRLLRERPALRGFIAIRAADELGAQMLNVAIGWYVYAATNDPMSLAYIGVAEHKDAGADARQKAWQSYCRILMASNEFIYVD